MTYSLSIFHLIYELLYEGRGGIHPNLEPLGSNELIVALKQRTGHAFGDNPERWAEWFLNDQGAGTEKERRSLRTILKIRKIERTAMEKISKEKD